MQLVTGNSSGGGFDAGFFSIYFTEEEIMTLMGFTRKTLQNRRSQDTPEKQLLPPWVLVGANYFYPKKEFYEWLKKQKRSQ